ncbi:MAG: metallophosphoesterase family protein [Ignisphaera sp.]|nr:metallophosphatase family protein [Ignisphaera sp.]MDW8085609.1 metallophosphoesterase family protein [Ignisphaera sp.]
MLYTSIHHLLGVGILDWVAQLPPVGFGMRVLMLSDIHGNADALRVVLESAGKWDAVWLLGDFVDYGPEPHVVIDIIRDLRPDALVMGNHDNAVAFDTDCRCAQEIHELSEYTRREVSLKLLSREQIEWLKTLPKTVEIILDGRRHYIVHGSPRNPLYGYVKPDLQPAELRLSLTPSMVALRPKPVEADVVAVGHTHVPMSITVDGIKVVNPGSCGQPRDGDPRASYAIYNTEVGSVEIRRVWYDIERVARKIGELKLEDRYSKWLTAILRAGKVQPP